MLHENITLLESKKPVTDTPNTQKYTQIYLRSQTYIVQVLSEAHKAQPAHDTFRPQIGRDEMERRYARWKLAVSRSLGLAELADGD